MKHFPAFLFITLLFFGCTHSDFKKTGGTRIVLEAMQGDLLKESMRADDSIGLATISETYKEYNQQKKTFFDLYFSKLAKADTAAPGDHFRVKGLTLASTAAECSDFFNKKFQESMLTICKNLAKRINELGLRYPELYNKKETPELIIVNLPGKTDIERIRRLLQSSAKLEFYETYESTEILPLLEKLNNEHVPGDTVTASKKTVPGMPNAAATGSLKEQLAAQDKEEANAHEKSMYFKKTNPFYGLLVPFMNGMEDGGVQLRGGPTIGSAGLSDTAKINEYLNSAAFKKAVGPYTKFIWSRIENQAHTCELVALKTERDGSARLSGQIIESAKKVFERSAGGAPEISMAMTKPAGMEWQKMTRDNIGRSIAIVLDGRLYSYPTVQGEIKGGVSSITGNFTMNAADDLVNVLNAGALPMELRIVQEEVVAPAAR